jgi:hypothetical protein
MQLQVVDLACEMQVGSKRIVATGNGAENQPMTSASSALRGIVRPGSRQAKG